MTSMQAANGELLPDALDRVALEACVGAALYPGIEVTGYIMNFPERFVEGEPFRISHDAVPPGEVTQFNAVPWQPIFSIVPGKKAQDVMETPGVVAGPRPDDVFTQVGGSDMVPWARGIGEDFQDMVDDWDRLGMVVDRGADGGSLLRGG